MTSTLSTLAAAEIQIALAPVPVTNELFAAIQSLPVRDAKELLKALRSGHPLNRKMRKILASAEEDADNISAYADACEADRLQA